MIFKIIIKSINTASAETLEGRYGFGSDRKTLIDRRFGNGSYEKIQNEVNKICCLMFKVDSSSTINTWFYINTDPSERRSDFHIICDGSYLSYLKIKNIFKNPFDGLTVEIKKGLDI